MTLRFLTDTQTPQPLVEMLRALGWDVRTVYEEGTEEEQDDVNHLIKARSLGRVLITFDQLRAESGARVAAELLLGGGKLIQITRDPAQDLHRALGRLLFHYPDWYPFLDVSHGVAVVSDINRNPRLYTPRQYSQTVSSSSKRHFEEYVAAWEVKRREPSRVRRRRLPSSEQTRLNLP